MHNAKLDFKWLFPCLLLAGQIGFWATSGSAQTTVGSIVGHVRDRTGAVLPAVEVSATNVRTGVSRLTVSNESGFYEVPQLTPGVYEIRAELPGFKIFRATGVRLQVRETARLDMTLEVGDLSDVVTVEGITAKVETRKAEQGKVVDNKSIIDLPLDGRNALELARLQPGVMPPEPGAVSSGNFSVNGQRGQNNNFLLEGGNNVDLAANFPTSNPNVDALQEFKVQSSSYDAEFGRNSGAQINVAIRSGTNELHGSLFEFHRNDATDARNFFLPETEKLIRNQFGFTLGGPVMRDKFFLFGSYEGLRIREEEAITDPLVPSQSIRDGKVGFLLNDSGRATLDPDGDGLIAVDPLARSLLDRFVPLPTGPVNPATGLGQLSSAVGFFTDSDQFIIKGDYQVSERNSLSVTYLWDRVDDFDASAFGNPSNTLPGFGDFSDSLTQNAIINDTHTFGPRMIHQFRFAYNRASIFSVLPENESDPASLGFTGIRPQNPRFSSVPNIQVSGAFSLGGSFQGPQSRGDDTFDLTDSLSWIRGDHSTKFGFNWTHFNQDFFFDFANNGLLVFGGIFGDPVVDFLAGAPFLYLQAGLPDLHFRQNTFSWFASDSWRVSERLSLDLGLRYDLFLPTYETRNKIATFDFIGDLKIGDTQSQVFPNAPPGLLFPGDPGIPRSTTATDKINLAPRLGFAYDLTGDAKMALRGGYGIYYNVLQAELQLQFLLAQPFGLQTTLGPFVGGAPFVGGFFGGFVGGPQHFAAPFEGQTNPFPFVSPAEEFVVPSDLTTLAPRMEIPYSHQYSLSYQWEFLRDYVLEVAYVGSTGINLLYITRANLIPFQRNPGGTISVQGTTPSNPSFNANQDLQDTGANSSYNSLQLSVNKRFTDGFGFLAAYTYGHSIDNASGLRDRQIQDPLRPDLERANSAFDIRQRLVLSYQYELPFGAGKRWGGGAQGALRQLVSGWQVGGIFTADEGFPLEFSVSGTPTTGAAALSNERPSLAGNPLAGVDTSDVKKRGVDAGTTYFNTDAFIRCDDTARGGVGGPCFGNLSRRFLKGPGDVNFDFIVLKRTAIPQINETANLEFRFEAFNLFNNPNFSDPGVSLGTGSFGLITSTKSGFLPRRLQFGLKFHF